MNRIDWVKEYRALSGTTLNDAIAAHDEYTQDGVLDVTPREALARARVLTPYTIVVGFNTANGIEEKTFNVKLPETQEEINAFFANQVDAMPNWLRFGNLMIKDFSYFYVS